MIQDIKNRAHSAVRRQQIQDFINSKRDALLKAPKHLISNGQSSISIQIDGQLCYIGMKIKDYFTKQGVNVPVQSLQSLADACDRLQYTQIQDDQKKAITVSSKPKKVAVVKDKYKGSIYYGVRQFIYRNDQRFYTRNGFNLVKDQLNAFIEKIRKVAKEGYFFDDQTIA